MTITAPDVSDFLHELVGEGFRAFTTVAQSERDDLYALTMSGLGGCTRQGAYRLAKTPPSEEMIFGEMREANLGTMAHIGLLPQFAKVGEGTEEGDVELHEGELVVRGRYDLYLPQWRVMADLKTITTYSIRHLERPPRRHRLQVAGYARAAEQAGNPVEWLAWIYLDRDSGKHKIFVEAFGEEVRQLVADRCTELATYAGDPDGAPRDERGPGLSRYCDSCPWLRQCWGSDAEPGVVGAQSILCHDDKDVEEAIGLYWNASATIKDAKAQQDFAKAMITGREPGRYGEWEYLWSAEGEMDDGAAAVEVLVAAGIPVPRKKTSRRLIIRRSDPGE